MALEGMCSAPFPAGAVPISGSSSVTASHHGQERRGHGGTARDSAFLTKSLTHSPQAAGWGAASSAATGSQRVTVLAPPQLPPA